MSERQTAIPAQVISWPKLLVGVLVTTVLSLSVHVVMLQNFHVPYPDKLQRSGWPAYPDWFCITLAIIYLYNFMRERFAGISIVVRCLAVFVLISMVRETLFRAPIMDLADTVSMTIYPIVKVLPKLLLLAILACCAVASAPYSKSAWRKWTMALILSAVVFWFCKPVIDTIFGQILKSISYLDSPVSYQPPYDYHIEIPAYLTFLEPVIASFVVGILAWSQLSSRPAMRALQLTLLILLLKGPALAPITYAFYSGLDPVTSLLSVGQFSLESLALGVLTTATLTLCIRRRYPDGSGPLAADSVS
ncbi:hypothetical protein [Caulobacter sp. S45]|uniref:hypothetical protein n=1 Tax=Caulobacter sp. S45 TaxID=1641861 RepID=UPI00131C5E03|nr:hypothetical protein [Caulobacter sp. S45]